MAESLLLPWVQGLVGKAADALVQRVTSMWGVDTYRRKLERQLVYVRSLLADAEEKAEAKTEAGRAVKAWMKKLKAAGYEADDVLDDFRYEALHREAQAGESTARKVLYFSRDRLVFHHKASRDLKDILDKIDELLAEMNTFGLLQRAEAPQVLYRQTYSAMDESMEIFGRDDDKEVVVNKLLNQQNQHYYVQVLPIIGMGGLGKTTLAKMVYNDPRVQNHFDLKMWYCVSDNFEATAIVRSVIKLATDGRCDLANNIELLRRKLQEVIGQKRFLLVLDDVWNEEQSKWEDDLKPLLCSSNGGSGSMIVVTSRSQQVASIMGTLAPHELKCLGEDDSWTLFSNKAFSNGLQDQPEFFTVGRRIVNKCKGLPLALKAMGGLMSSKPRVQQWEDIAKRNLGGAKDEVLSILKLSYRNLSSEMKQCFAFCAVFPKDYVIEKDMLTQLWLANGFFHEEGARKNLLAQKAEFVFNELVWRSFLEDVKERQVFYSGRYKTVGFKMHDLVHDLAKDVTDECAFATELIQNKTSIKDVYHMQISRDESNETSGLLKGTSPLRTLLTQSKHNDLKELKLMSLRALCCKDPFIIDSQLINVAHLRYLDLSLSDIVGLPDSLCMLYNLQSLRLNNCARLQYLPEGMTVLRNLEHLYLLGCESLKRMPPKLSLLHNLRTLTTFIVDTEDDCGIEELKDLRQLEDRLELYNLCKVKTGSESNIHDKQNLSELLLHWGRKLSYDPASEEVSNAEQVLESLAPHGELKVLELHQYVGSEISQWMRDPRMFRCLKKLRISWCKRCKELPMVWLSSSLEELFLSSMDSMTTLCKNVDAEDAGYNNHMQIFPKLNKMELWHLPELERWAENSAGEPSRSVVFPLLKVLRIDGCPKLTSLPECPSLTRLYCRTSWSISVAPSSLRSVAPVTVSMPLGLWPSLVHLEVGVLSDVVIPLQNQQGQSQRPLDTLRSLKIYHDDGFVSIFNQSTLQLGLKDCFPFLERLEFDSCSNIVCWPVEELRCLPCLRSLYFLGCNKLEGNGSSYEEILPLPQLETLQIASCDSLLEIPMLPPSLEEMGIRMCGSLLALPSNLGSLVKLRNLYLFRCDGLKALPNGTDGLTSLEQLTISECPGIEKFPHVLLQRLPALKYLHIEGCPDLQRRCREGGEYFDSVSPIPRKTILSVESELQKPTGVQSTVCFLNPYSNMRLLEIPKLPASLEEMKISYRISLVALPSNLGNLAKLRMLGMWGCDRLRELPDGMDGLTSLERLAISGCSGIEKFPQGLLRWLSALKYLCIHGCPDLQRRCRNSGDYFDLVSSIPDKFIPATESKKNKFVKKLLPFY
ncbi:unnamed protein product [Miscanthus lutarioriparius]|uniref:Uncharacterized protein n=1 Tax=Miscanthus lutarioriparius TaxID=422564 RepID=A0A811PT78_9POAL|nr:unnamed protein product [Miscanthus lutarioriparius]